MTGRLPPLTFRRTSPTSPIRHLAADTQHSRCLLQLSSTLQRSTELVGGWLIMKEQNSIEQPAALTDIPMLAEYDRELTEAVAKSEPSPSAQQARRLGSTAPMSCGPVSSSSR